MIVYTSGTTNRPKGVVTTHANITAQIESLVTAWEWTAADRTLLVLPLHHVHGIINVVCCALWSGAVLEIHSKFDSEATWDRLASGELTVFTAVPTIYHRLIQSWEAASPQDSRRALAGLPLAAADDVWIAPPFREPCSISGSRLPVTCCSSGTA